MRGLLPCWHSTVLHPYSGVWRLLELLLKGSRCRRSCAAKTFNCCKTAPPTTSAAMLGS